MRCFCIAIHIFMAICVLVTSPSSSLALNGFFDESTPPLPPRSTTHYPLRHTHPLPLMPMPRCRYHAELSANYGSGFFDRLAASKRTI